MVEVVVYVFVNLGRSLIFERIEKIVIIYGALHLGVGEVAELEPRVNGKVIEGIETGCKGEVKVAQFDLEVPDFHLGRLIVAPSTTSERVAQPSADGHADKQRRHRQKSQGRKNA